MASPIFISNPPPGFSFLAILRGIQLAILGAYRSLQNPKLFESRYYTHAISAIKYSILIQLVLWSPIVCLRVLANFLGLFVNLSLAESAANSLKYLQFNLLNVGVFAISASRYFGQLLDTLFLSSLEFIDSVYLEKHQDHQSQRFHLNLVELSVDTIKPPTPGLPTLQTLKKLYSSSQEFSVFVKRHLKKAFLNIIVFLLSELPYVGAVIIGLMSFQNLNNKIGTERAVIIFGILQVIPKEYSVAFFTIFYGSRSMVHDLLLPYFARVRFTSREKEHWLKAREGVLFGFGLCFFSLIRYFPWVGLLIYGLAETSVAYLITKVSDPPPNQVSQLIHWNETQLVWNKEKEQNILSGTFVSGEEGYNPIPGSFIFT
ncbi:hypothetical protein METBIDRAFT_76808 [Metschnikowia bicuspidata var. bicuspidata NRRL YB-4993]|uniref:Uncharacterized protein n=1 Tax=Metschnikowia bicuspidata var. bicuspidata NRRL YB-4993 TaxID=869754 RepID=A0A1A0HIP8_9ASCO|nr:hypothetical protein METBIDRAFT_76808 [Metschnikowia bicuspidata var. bicuspidata NRRL YB-4993]OBA23885.1 hypothetical protein METBIDRAFT_76808 [Metschnikowia bicuspidata var. bicuspidata NRRL YB-4993]